MAMCLGLWCGVMDLMVVSWYWYVWAASQQNREHDGMARNEKMPRWLVRVVNQVGVVLALPVNLPAPHQRTASTQPAPIHKNGNLLLLPWSLVKSKHDVAENCNVLWLELIVSQKWILAGLGPAAWPMKTRQMISDAMFDLKTLLGKANNNLFNYVWWNLCNF